MNNLLPKNLVMIAALCVSCAAANADNKTNAPAPRPLAAFVDDAQRGKDPFFPESARRNVQPIANAGKETQSIAIGAFSLKGISRSALQPLALINNATIAVGESAEVRAAGRPIKIRCREIRDRSVLIEIDGTGELKELKLREGI
jgi:hypothetical protein